jgi:FtsH-binding integral membrane protein
MPHIERPNSREEEHRIFEQQDGSEWMIIGAIITAVGFIVSIFNFSDLRQGTHLMIAYSSSLIFVGLVLVGYGEYKRSYNA